MVINFTNNPMTGLLMKGSSEKGHAHVIFHSMGLSQSKNSPLDITQKSVTALPTTKAFRSTKTSHLLKILTYVGCFFGSIPNTKFLEKGHTRCPEKSAPARWDWRYRGSRYPQRKRTGCFGRTRASTSPKLQRTPRSNLI